MCKHWLWALFWLLCWIYCQSVKISVTVPTLWHTRLWTHHKHSKRFDERSPVSLPTCLWNVYVEILSNSVYQFYPFGNRFESCRPNHFFSLHYSCSKILPLLSNGANDPRRSNTEAIFFKIDLFVCEGSLMSVSVNCFIAGVSFL